VYGGKEFQAYHVLVNALNFFLGLRARLLEAKGGKSKSVSGIFGEIFNGVQASNL